MALTKRVLELGRQRNMTGQLIATTRRRARTNGSSPTSTGRSWRCRAWNRRSGSGPACLRAGVEEARSIGIKVKPSWWHNWPRLETPQAYTGVPPLSLGWSEPDYGTLAAGAIVSDAVMPWGGNGFGQHYSHRSLIGGDGIRKGMIGTRCDGGFLDCFRRRSGGRGDEVR